MKAVQVVARGIAEFIEMPKPEVSEGKVLIRTQMLSLCGSDIFMLHHAADEQYPFPPGTTGHEMLGVIEQINAPGSNFKVGDTVLALAPGHRAMAEFFLAEHKHVVPLPSGASLEHLLQAQQYGTVLYGMQRLPNVIGKSVAIIGQGSAGLWFNFTLRRMGAKRVIAIDQEAFRLEHSQYFGATDVLNNSITDSVQGVMDLNDGELPDIVIEAAGEVDSINLALDLVRKYGEILYFGVPRAQTFPFNYDRLFHKCCRATTIVGSFYEMNQESTRIAMETIASGAIDLSPMITHNFPFDQVIEAYEMHRTRADGAIKIIIDMPH